MSGARAAMAELLRIEGLTAGYGEAVVVQGIDLALEQGQSLALLGRNGTGKTTLLNTLVGVTRRHAGRIVLAGCDLTALAPHRRAAAGIGWVPQERNIFRSLTVEENLSAVARPGPWTVARVCVLGSIWALACRRAIRRSHWMRAISPTPTC